MLRRILPILLAALTLAGCGGEATPTPAAYKALIVGTWTDDSGEITKFATNGTRTNSKPSSSSCWSIIEGDTLVLNSPGARTTPTVKIVRIDATTMQLKAPLATRTFTRIDTNGTLTAEEQMKADTQNAATCPAP